MDFVRCVCDPCAARVPASAPPVCDQHVREVEPGIRVDRDGGREFVPATDGRCAWLANEPLLNPRRAIRWRGRTWEFGAPMSSG